MSICMDAADGAVEVHPRNLSRVALRDRRGGRRVPHWADTRPKRQSSRRSPMGNGEVILAPRQTAEIVRQRDRCDRGHYLGKAYGRQPDSSTAGTFDRGSFALMLDVAITRRVVVHAPGRR